MAGGSLLDYCVSVFSFSDDCSDRPRIYTVPGSRRVWQRRNRFMVVAQVPVVPRAPIEDSRRRVPQDEIEISISIVLHSRSDIV
jgi:hypothetical protein